MWHIGWDVEEISGSRDEVVLKRLAVPHAGFAAENIDGGLVALMFVRLRPFAGRILTISK